MLYDSTHKLLYSSLLGTVHFIKGNLQNWTLSALKLMQWLSYIALHTLHFYAYIQCMQIHGMIQVTITAFKVMIYFSKIYNKDKKSPVRITNSFKHNSVNLFLHLSVSELTEVCSGLGNVRAVHGI